MNFFILIGFSIVETNQCKMKFVGAIGEYFEVIDEREDLNKEVHAWGEEEYFYLLWIKSGHAKIIVNAIEYEIDEPTLIPLTSYGKVFIPEVDEFQLLKYNKSFLCVVNADSDVGCKGLLYFGSLDLPIINLDTENLNLVSAEFLQFKKELKVQDKMQLEMLRMILKRILIICTREYKAQKNLNIFENVKIDLIRDFSFQVEQNFRTYHTVADYGRMLNKSPKTISNVFKKITGNAPLKFIHDRIMVEARNMLAYSNLEVSQIGYDLGFQDVQAFSRFFKRYQEIPPSAFRNQNYQI